MDVRQRRSSVCFRSTLLEKRKACRSGLLKHRPPSSVPLPARLSSCSVPAGVLTAEISYRALYAEWVRKKSRRADLIPIPNSPYTAECSECRIEIAMEDDEVLELRPNCECCDKELAPDAVDAMICSFECTFCVECVENRLGRRCPNCGGNFVPRPIRPASKLAANPPLAKRVFNPHGCGQELRDSSNSLWVCSEADGVDVRFSSEAVRNAIIRLPATGNLL